MKLTPWCWAACAGLAPLGTLVGVPVAVMGHVAILAVTMGIFFGTLSIGRGVSRVAESAGGPAAAGLESPRASGRA